MEMIYRHCGRSGLRLSALSFGSWVSFKNQVDLKAAKEMMSLCYEAGVNFFDNAEAYAEGASEEIMGQALKELGFGRDTYCVSSKVFWGGQKPTQRGLSRKHIRDACDAALRRLQVDYLDLYYCHRPDVSTPVEETLSAMTDLIRQGKILYWGTSEWSATQIMEAYAMARQNNLEAPIVEQPQYNLFHRERVEVEYQAVYRRLGIGTTIWSPLASGLLTGKYSKGLPKDSRVHLPGYEWLKERFESEEGRQKIQIADQLAGLAAELDMSLAQLSIAWCLRKDYVSSVILGASKVQQLNETLQSLDHLHKLDFEVQNKIEEILNNKPAPEPVF